MRGATKQANHDQQPEPISIHAPHAGRDQKSRDKGGEALKISIHAPHAGRDRTPGLYQFSSFYFNPRAPCGARQQK